MNTIKPKSKYWLLVAIVAAVVAIVAPVNVFASDNTTTEEQPKTSKPESGCVKTFTLSNGVTFNMVYVEGGTFEMGSDSSFNESPVHSVTLSDYWIGQTEVTQELWQAVMGANSEWSSDFGLDPKYPAYDISYTDCQEFIKKLNGLTGQHFRMPTEAEWEYAARGGNKSEGCIFSGSNTLDSVGWYGDNSGCKIHEVGTKEKNELGIYDMSGNVWEWCSDWYGSYSNGSQTNPKGPSNGSTRVIRGGGWLNLDFYCLVVYRLGDLPDYGKYNRGLRLTL